MAIARFDQLSGVAEGQEVEVVGRYERWSPDLAPPGQVPVSARVVLGDGVGILVGRYRAGESRRPDDELVRLAGATVRVVGRFSKGRDYPGPGPMPGLWTGGGPQVVDVVRVELIEAAAASSPPPVAVLEPAPAGAPALAPPPHILPPPAPPPARFTMDTVARRSLAGGRSRLVAAAPIGALFGRWMAAREHRWLAARPWPFDVASYLAQLDGERSHSTLRIDVELAVPVADVDRAALFDAGRLARATVSWPHTHVVSILCPRVETDVTINRAIRPRYDNARVHRWFRHCAVAAIQPLSAACGIRAVAAHIE